MADSLISIEFKVQQLIVGTVIFRKTQIQNCAVRKLWITFLNRGTHLRLGTHMRFFYIIKIAEKSQ